MAVLKGAREVWQGTAVLTLNVLIAFALANLVAFLALIAFPQAAGPAFDPDVLESAYPGRALAEIRQIQRETWGRKYVYEPFTQFKEGAVSGNFVNVDVSGFRRPPHGAPWPPEPGALTVFVFGGSTTFGYGVVDHETVPAALERLFKKSANCPGLTVYNLGRSNYYSTQERILFSQLLAAGLVPTAAVFIDGLNEFGYLADEPKFTRRLGYLMAEGPGQLGLRALKSLPLARLLRRARPDQPQDLEVDFKQDASWSEGEIARILNRWRENRRLIRAVGREYSVLTTFVVQPVPSFDFDLEQHPFISSGRTPDPRTGLPHSGYSAMLERLGAAPEDALLWLGGAHHLIDPPHYVDRVHYSATFSTAIAGEIARALQPLLCGENPPDD